MSEESYDSDFDPENEAEFRKTHERKTHVQSEKNVGNNSAQCTPFSVNKKIRLSSIQEISRVKSKAQLNKPTTSSVANMSESDSDDAVSAKSTQSGFDYDLSSLPEGSRTIAENYKHVSTLHKGLTSARKRFERQALPYFNLPSTSKDMNPSVSGLFKAHKKKILETYHREKFEQYSHTKKIKEDKFVQISPKKMFSDNQSFSDKLREEYLEKECQLNLHKTHLLCLVAHGLYVNSVVIKSCKVFKYLYSQLPHSLKENESITISYIKKLLNWFGHRYKICRDTPVSGTITNNHLESLFLGDAHKQKKYSLKDLVMLFVLLLRGMGVSARFVMSLQPVPLRPKKTNEDISYCSSKSKPQTDITILEDINKPGPSGTQQFKTNKLKEELKPEKQKDKDLHVSSSDSENEYEANILNGGIDYWIEVFMKEENKWISVDVYSLEIDCPREIYSRCTKPAAYVVGWKNDNFCKEVTRRYIPMWHITSNVRVCKSWFEESICPFLIRDKTLDKLEEVQLDNCQAELNNPIPSKITELRYHPLYAVERYLSKYECIYPEAIPLGFIKGEPVYSRDSIHELHTPVDRMQERNKFPALEETKELHGPWEDKNYVPPELIDNIIPKNDFGAIEVYNPSMLPAGTVHLQVPGIFQIAKKISIDCAPAIVGWNHRSSGSHPIIEGVVVCKENEELLMDAWNSGTTRASKASKVMHNVPSNIVPPSEPDTTIQGLLGPLESTRLDGEYEEHGMHSPINSEDSLEPSLGTEVDSMIKGVDEMLHEVSQQLQVEDTSTHGLDHNSKQK